jgi:hypothetical protein
VSVQTYKLDYELMALILLKFMHTLVKHTSIMLVYRGALDGFFGDIDVCNREPIKSDFALVCSLQVVI